jgi:hypothetical protein
MPVGHMEHKETILNEITMGGGSYRHDSVHQDLPQIGEDMD